MNGLAQAMNWCQYPHGPARRAMATVVGILRVNPGMQFAYSH